MLKIIVFDCDGVMFDSKNSNCQFYNHLLKHFGRPPMSEAELDFVHIHSTTTAIAHIFRHYPEQDLQEVDRYRLTCDYAPYLQLLEIEKDLITFLEITYPRYHLAISTNRTNTIEPLLRRYDLDQYFGKVMTAQNARRPKPAPDALEEILEHYGCHAHEAIYIGDSIIDEEHAASCNVPFIAFKNKVLRADYHVDCFMEILKLQPFTSGQA
jgi:phosphoglycolate phosphatase